MRWLSRVGSARFRLSPHYVELRTRSARPSSVSVLDNVNTILCEGPLSSFDDRSRNLIEGVETDLELYQSKTKVTRKRAAPSELA